MLSLCPHHQCSTSELPLEEAMVHELHCKPSFACFSPLESDEASYYHHHTQSQEGFSPYCHLPTELELDLGHGLHLSPATDGSLNATKKMSHNAYERDRRKKLNDLYSLLQMLLPGTDQRKKLSIPSTVARVLKYIPELQRQVKHLSQRKKILLSKARERKHDDYLRWNEGGKHHPIISAGCLNSSQIIMQICISNKAIGVIQLSKVLKILDVKGLQLMNASTLTTHGDLTFYNLHLQTNELISMEHQAFCDQLVNFVKDQSSLVSNMAIRHHVYDHLGKY